MNCPKCHHENYTSSSPCEHCQFQGNVAEIEELLHINWLLGEIETWGKSPSRDVAQNHIQQIYTKRKLKLEVSLELRLRPFNDEEARVAWMEIFRSKRLLRRLNEWVLAEHLREGDTHSLRNSLNAKIGEYRQRLGDRPHPDSVNDTERLKAINFIIENVEKLAKDEAFVSPKTAENILTGLEDETEALEVKLGLRELASPPPITDEEVIPPEHLPAPLSRPPSLVPLSQRLRHALLSERTLYGILFLGIFLLFSAAVSFVVWGWRDFSPLMRVSIPVGFTAMFFALSWYVRTKTPLYRSSIALSAIAALLVPIDAYTVYVNFGSPPHYWAEFWQISSLVCLAIYVIATLIIQNKFFSYLVGTAAGSLMLASIEVAHQGMGLSRDWYSAGLIGLAAGLVLLAETLARLPESSRWRIFIDPFRVAALLATGVLMPLTFGWRFVDRSTYDTLHSALTFNWWVGSIIIAWGTIQYRSRTLGFLTFVALPVTVYLTQAPIFYNANVHPAWHAFGWACLTLVYFVIGYKLTRHAEDTLLHDHGKNASRWGTIMLGVAALWPFMDITGGEAVAASHAILVVVVILATIFWRRPWYLYGVGVLAFSATTFALTAFDLTLAQASVGWISLSLLLIVVALNLGNRSREMGAKFAPPLLYSGYVIAALALVPGFFPYDEARLVYSLGNWLGLAVWGAYLTHRQQPGYGKFKSIFHWFAALPLPFWVWVLLEYYHQPDYISALVFAALAWGMVFIAHRLARLKTSYRFPWRQTGLVVSVLAPIIALLISDYTRPLTLLSAGLLYFVDAFMSRKSRELFPAGLVFAMGLADLLDKADISTDPRLLALALLAGLYLLAGLWGERRKVTTGKFLAPLYFISHAIIAYVLMRVLTRSLFVYPVYTDTMRLWDAASLILPGVVYMLYAWGRNRERWAHAGVWLGALGGVFLVSALSHGTGFSAAVASAASVALILVERGLYHLRRHPRLSRSQQVLASFTSRLYHNPLLFGGWTISLGTIALALGRNLVILEGGRVQQIWAVVALTIITALYAGSAYLFRKTRFVWLAALLVFAPWTILTDMGWFTFYRLTSPGFSASWMVLAWTLYGVSRWVQHISHRRYALPVKVVTHLLTVFALAWAFTDAEASRYAFGMAMSLYVLMSWVKHGEIRRDNGEEVSSLEANKYLYPAVGLFLVWSLYLLELLPGAEVEHYGLLLLLLSPLVLAMGRWLRRAAPRPEIRRDYPFPAYLGAYLALLAGTILVSEQVALLSMALLYNALIMLFSVWIFRHPAWVIPAVGLAPLSLLLALDVAHISEDRWGWWLMGLSVTYLAAAWLLRRVKQRKYSTAPILAALTLTALGLIPSSADQIAALWGYAAATLIYAFTAFWLKRPVLLTPASAFVVVPYVIALDRSALAFDYYGLALLPGAILALLGGWLLERAYGDWNNFPWMEFRRWPRALWERWLGWWGLPLYALGLGLATSSPFFTGGRSDLAALTLFLLAGFYGWAIYRFRSRFWLLAVALSVHLGAVLTIDALGWWQHNPDVGRLLFTPVTVITALLALWLEHRLKEESPFSLKKLLIGWSRPLYLFVIFDIFVSQIDLSGNTAASVWVTIIHALLLLGFASVWRRAELVYLATALGALALYFWAEVLNAPDESLLVYFSYLVLAYGLVGYGIHLYKKYKNIPDWLYVWRLPAQRSGILLSFAVLLFTFVMGIDLVDWTVRALVGIPFKEIVSLSTVQMVVSVFSLLGLLYLSDALVYGRIRQTYIAVGMLLTGWMLFAFYTQEWNGLRQTQWYALPTGVYLLGISALERRTGNKRLVRGLDYAALFLMLGSLFWQTLSLGWEFALLLGAEGLGLFLMGSARRLRRFFYAGIIAVVLATLGQLINALQAVNQWITFGIIGLLMVSVAILVERNLDDIKAWQGSFDDWE